MDVEWYAYCDRPFFATKGESMRQRRVGELERWEKRPGSKTMRLSITALAVCAAMAHGAGRGENAKADSLRTLRMVLTSEMHSEDTALIIKRPRLADSLLAKAAPRESFLRSLRDTAAFLRLNTPAEFEAYWKGVERRNGFNSLKRQMDAHDVDKTLVPKVYLFDSAVVVFPGWIILRRAPRASLPR